MTDPISIGLRFDPKAVFDRVRHDGEVFPAPIRDIAQDRNGGRQYLGNVAARLGHDPEEYERCLTAGIALQVVRHDGLLDVLGAKHDVAIGVAAYVCKTFWGVADAATLDILRVATKVELQRFISEAISGRTARGRRLHQRNGRG